MLLLLHVLLKLLVCHELFRSQRIVLVYHVDSFLQHIHLILQVVHPHDLRRLLNLFQDAAPEGFAQRGCGKSVLVEKFYMVWSVRNRLNRLFYITHATHSFFLRALAPF